MGSKAKNTKPTKKTPSGKKISVRGNDKIKPIRTKPRKPKLPTFKCEGCQEDFTDRKIGGWSGENPRWHCQDCLPRQRKAKEQDGFAWYVLQCEPDKDRLVVKDIKRKLRIDSLEHYVKKLLVPTELREKIVEERGDIVARGNDCKHLNDAKIASLAEAKVQAGLAPNEELNSEDRHPIPGYRTACYMDRDTGKWKWHVRKIPENPKATRKVVQCKKFAGYVLVHMKWDAFIDATIRKVRNAWGFLLRPVILNTIVQVQQSKLTGRWAWKLRHHETREIIKKGKGFETRGAAAHAGGLAKAALESFHPTAVKTKEAAELLIRQKAVNQICKDKEELNRVTYKPRIGDVVAILKPHAFSGVECKVAGVDQKAGTVNLTAEMMGQQVPIPAVETWQVDFKSRPKPETVK